jgi:hypothetical protein
VGVDKPGQQRGVAQVDYGSARGQGGGAYGLNLSVRDDDYSGFDDLPGSAVEEALRLEHIGLVLRHEYTGRQRQEESGTKEFHKAHSVAGSWGTILAALLLSACGPDPKPNARAVLVGWRPIQSWSGHGDMQTESFNIESGQWRIKWATSNENPPGLGSFRVTVHSAVSGRPLVVAVEHRGTGRGIAYVNEDPRLYHLVVESKGVDWSVAVEDSSVGYGSYPTN